jgi:[protein-PII] uridylyltransferase
LFEPEHPGRLAEVAAMLAAAGLDIHKAASHPLRGGGGTLDLFEVRTADPAHVAIPQRRQQSIGADIQAVLLGELRLEDAVARKLGQSRLPPRKRPDVTLSVLLDNEFDPGFTIVEVKAPDAPGLLALLARSLSDLSLQVDRSIISTEGDRAIDTFYVVDQAGQKLDDAGAIRARQRILGELERVAEGWRT